MSSSPYNNSNNNWSTNNPLLRATPNTNDRIYQQRRTLPVNQNNYQQSSLRVSFGAQQQQYQNRTGDEESSPTSSFVPRESSSSYYSQQRQQQHRDPYLPHQSSPSTSSNSSPENNAARLQNYMLRPSIEKGLVSSPKNQQQQQHYQQQSGGAPSSPTFQNSSSPFSPSPNQRYQNQQRSPSDLNQPRPFLTSTTPPIIGNSSTSSSPLAERFANAERLISQVYSKHGHLLDDENDRETKGNSSTSYPMFSSFQQPTRMERMNFEEHDAKPSSPSSSAPSSPPRAGETLASVKNLQNIGFANSTIQNILSLNTSLEKGKDVLERSEKKTDEVRTDLTSQLTGVQTQINKMNEDLENWKKKILEMSPMRQRGSQYSYDPDEDV